MIVITGGAGFIGSNLAAALEARGEHEVIVVDRLGTDDKWRNLAKRELAGLIAPSELTGLLDAHASEIDTIFHMGAISTTTENDVDLIVANNIELSLKLWDWCAWRGARFIYASSAATYGDGAAGFDDDGSIEGLSRLRPLNAYGWSKHMVDRRIARLVASGGAAPPQWAGLKFFNVYGPNEYHKGGQQSVVAQLYRQLVQDKPARLFRSYRDDYPNGGQRRDFVSVDDCVGHLLFLYDHPEISGLFNSGSGTARSWVDLANAVFAALERKPHIEFIDMPDTMRDRYQYFTEASMHRMTEAGYDRPATSLEDGVALYVRNYLMAADPYR
jgi:ADP-L-glycero-D-manno-heptose 6-epimerase